MKMPMRHVKNRLLHDLLKKEILQSSNLDLTHLAFFVQVIEFVQFKDRLHRSMQYISVKSDSVMLHLKQKADSLDEVEVRPPLPI